MTSSPNLHSLQCPSIRICLMLVMGIIASHLLSWQPPSAYWLIALLSVVAVCIFTKSKYVQSFLLHIAICLLGVFLYAHQAETDYNTPHTYSYNELSTIDKAKLKTREFRQQLVAQYANNHLEAQEYAIVAAMTLGDKSSLDSHTRHVFSQSGASHVLAISGLHIGILFQVFIIILGGKRRWVMLSVPPTLVCIWIYVFLIGMPASAIRSALMASIFCFSLITRRNSPLINSLFLTAIVMLCINPTYLFEMSFQMSFLAVLSIILLYKPLYGSLPKSLYRFFVLRWAWAMLCVSASAQIGTLPIIVYYFGHISCYSALSSFVAIPATTLILYLSLLFFCLSPFSALHFLQGIVASLLQEITSFSIYSLKVIGSLPGAYITGIKINILQLCLIYMAIVTGCLIIRRLHLYHSHRIRLAVADCTDYTHQEYRKLP